MASWSRRELGRLPCREFREANRYQTEHLEQLPGVNYIMSLRDGKAPKRGCCAVRLCGDKTGLVRWRGGWSDGRRGSNLSKNCWTQNMLPSASNMKWTVTENRVFVWKRERERKVARWSTPVEKEASEVTRTRVLTGQLFLTNIPECISLGTILFNLAANMQRNQLRQQVIGWQFVCSWGRTASK